MMRQRLRTNLIALLAISLTLTFVQTPLTPAVAAVCQGEAAYPPDLPDCLDPVVEAQQEAAAAAAARAAADKLAADNAAAERAAAAAAVAAADRAAAAQAAAKAAADKAAADALAEQIRQGNLAAAATAATRVKFGFRIQSPKETQPPPTTYSPQTSPSQCQCRCLQQTGPPSHPLATCGLCGVHGLSTPKLRFSPWLQLRSLLPQHPYPHLSSITLHHLASAVGLYLGRRTSGCL